jgi:hypothetical protein
VGAHSVRRPPPRAVLSRRRRRSPRRASNRPIAPARRGIASARISRAPNAAFNGTRINANPVLAKRMTSPNHPRVRALSCVVRPWRKSTRMPLILPRPLRPPSRPCRKCPASRGHPAIRRRPKPNRLPLPDHRTRTIPPTDRSLLLSCAFSTLPSVPSRCASFLRRLVLLRPHLRAAGGTRPVGGCGAVPVGLVHGDVGSGCFCA